MNERYPQATRPLDCFQEEDELLESAEPPREAGQLPFDLSGNWAHMEMSSTLSAIPLYGEVETIMISHMWLQMEQDGNQIRMIAQDCQFESHVSSSMSDFVIPDAYLRALEPSRRLAFVEPGDSGFRFRQSRYTRVVGAELEDPINDPLPSDASDPRLIDQDQDGNVGVTVRTEGLISGEIYLVQRNWVELCGDVLSPDYLSGYLRWGADEQVLGASNFMLNRNTDSIPNPDWQHNRFVSCRIPEGWACQEIIANRETVYAECPLPDFPQERER